MTFYDIPAGNAYIALEVISETDEKIGDGLSEQFQVRDGETTTLTNPIELKITMPKPSGGTIVTPPIDVGSSGSTGGSGGTTNQEEPPSGSMTVTETKTEAYEGELVDVNLSANYTANSGIASYIWTDENGTTVLNGQSGTVKVLAGSTKTFNCSITSNNGYQTSDSSTITINKIVKENTPPIGIISVGTSRQELKDGETADVSLIPNYNDSDGISSIVFSYNGNFLANATNGQTSYVKLGPGVYPIVATVTDGKNLSITSLPTTLTINKKSAVSTYSLLNSPTTTVSGGFYGDNALRFSLINNNNGTGIFILEKVAGYFEQASVAEIRMNSTNGTVLGTANLSAGTFRKEIPVNFDNIGGYFPVYFYVSLKNDQGGGVSWAGSIAVQKVMK